MVNKKSTPTPQAVALYHALRARDIFCILEDGSDGYKHVDISIPWAKINIEVDGLHHYTQAHQILSDFDRSYYSAVDSNIDTFHVPNIILETHLDQVAGALATVARKKYADKKNDVWWKKLLRAFFE